VAAPVPLYRAQNDPMASGLGPRPDAQPIKVFQAGDMAAQLSKSLGDVATSLTQKDRLDSVFYAHTQAAAARSEAQQLFQSQADAATGEAKDFTPAFLKSLDEAWKPRIDAAPNDYAKKLLGIQLGDIKASLTDNALKFESQSRVADRTDKLGQAQEASRNAVLHDPTQLDGAVHNLESSVASAQLPPRVADKELTQGKAQLYQAHWLGRGLNDPRGTLAALKAAPPEGLRYEDYLPLVSRLDEMVKAEDRQKAQEARLAKAEAKAEAAQRMADNRASLGQRLQGEVAMRSDGKAPGTPIVFSDVAAAYGPHQAEKVWNGIQDNVRMADAVGLAGKQSFPEQDAEAARLAPTATDPEEYGNQAQAHKAYVEAVGTIRGQFRQDPAGYVQGNLPAVRDAFQQARQDPSKLGAAIALSVANQERIDPAGTPEPLPKDLAAETVTRFKQAAGGDERLGLLAPYTVGLQNDDLARRALKQLEAAGLPQGADRALERYRQGDTASARELMGWLTVDPKNLPREQETKAQAVDQALDALYQDGNLATAEAHAATATGQPGNYENATRGRELIRKGALIRAAAGDDPATAVANAYRTLHGTGAATSDPDLGIVPLPPSLQPSAAPAFESGLRALRDGVDLSHLAPTRETVAALLPPGSPPGTVEAALAMAQRNQAAWEADARAGARWVAAPGGYQLALPGGQVVPGPDGKARVWKEDEITHAAIGALSRPTGPLSGDDTAFPAQPDGPAPQSAPGGGPEVRDAMAKQAEAGRLREMIVRHVRAGQEPPPELRDMIDSADFLPAAEKQKARAALGEIAAGSRKPSDFPDLRAVEPSHEEVIADQAEKTVRELVKRLGAAAVRKMGVVDALGRPVAIPDDLK
jgi:hypothetical protein